MSDARGTKVLVGVPSKEYGLGRPCAMPNCKTTLSRYNPGTFCSAHEPRFEPRLYERGEELRVCRRCHEAKPSTSGYFRRRERGLSAVCKVCTSEQHVEHRRRAREDKERKRLETKRCPRCEKTKPRTVKFWRVSKTNADGLSQYCDDCILVAWREASAKSRKKKAMAVTYESPQGIMRGTVEA
jgi:ssDNA-binding Zn-finger/Zn-ribbon topoisomerase 1